jgi:CheY-like chemotaxis protein
MRILLVEDSNRLREAVAKGLRESGYAVDATGDGSDGLWMAQENSYDVLLLDIMLPGIDGLSILDKIRGEVKETPVLFLTAKDTIADRVKGLRRGADDYLVKPFALEELRLDFKFTKGNSGVQVRSKEIDKSQVRGYQVEIADATKMGLWHHSLAPEKYRSRLGTAGQLARIGPDGKKTFEQRADPAKVQSACKDNQWNELVVRAVGARLVQKINGVVFAELIDEDAKHSSRSGLLALQDHGKGCVVAFRDIRIKHLRAKDSGQKDK